MPVRTKTKGPVGPSETRLVHYILAQLQDRYPDDLWERQNVVRVAAEDRFIRANTKGAADIRGIHQGRAIELEAKLPGEVQTAAQIERMKRVRQAKGIYEVVHSLVEALAVVARV